jgi:hypothetical protein
MYTPCHIVGAECCNVACISAQKNKRWCVLRAVFAKNTLMFIRIEVRLTTPAQRQLNSLILFDLITTLGAWMQCCCAKFNMLCLTAMRALAIA